MTVFLSVFRGHCCDGKNHSAFVLTLFVFLCLLPDGIYYIRWIFWFCLFDWVFCLVCIEFDSLCVCLSIAFFRSKSLLCQSYMVCENLIVIGQNWSACSVWVVLYWHSCLGEETTFCWIYTLQLKWKPAWGGKYKHISSSTAVYCWGLAFTQPLVCDMGRESGVKMCAVHSSLVDRAW